MNQQQTPHAWDADDNKPVIPKIPGPRAPHAAEPSDLAVAVRVGNLLLSDYGDSSREGFSYPEAYGALREALRLVLRAHDTTAGASQ
ncbi:hypothetical protein [Streptomyces griseorubiginosus]|uniref:hypothetical protein n=1 Tax=Streptomyces griseorubiginosus TaxID=67304 RepID=UPI0036EECBAD